MKKFIRTLFFLLFTLFVGALTEYAFSTEVEEVIAMSDSSMNEAYTDTGKVHCFSDLELGEFTQSQHRINYSRVQRTVSLENSAFFKMLIKTMAEHTTTLVQHWGKIYDSPINGICQPPSKYYIFALRRIIV